MGTAKHAKTKLLVHSCIHEDENLTAYRMRIAEENGLDKPYWAFERMGKAFQNKLESIQKTAILTEQPFEHLLSRAYLDLLHYAVHINWCGSLVSREMIRKAPALCPVCIKEKAYIRSFWDLRTVVACPYHDCWLVDKCPSCKNTIHWDGIRGTRCLCGYSLDCSDGTTVASKEAISLAAISEIAFGFKSEALLKKAAVFPETLLKLPLSILIQLYKEIVYRCFKYDYGKPQGEMNFESFDLIFDASAANYFVSVFSNWPSGLSSPPSCVDFSSPSSRKNFLKIIRFFPNLMNGLVSDGFSPKCALDFLSCDTELSENSPLGHELSETEASYIVDQIMRKR